MLSAIGCDWIDIISILFIIDFDYIFILFIIDFDYIV